MSHKNIIIILSLLFFYSCAEKKMNKQEELYNKALDCWFQYAQTEDTSFLYRSNEYIDSIDCRPIKKKEFDLKLSLMFAMKDYHVGKNYINRFEVSDFGMPYKKQMYLTAFDAMILESQGDTIQRNHLYKKMSQEIQQYLEKNPNRETLFDFFAIKEKIETKENISQKIELLKMQGKYDNSFLDTLAMVIGTNDKVEEIVKQPDGQSGK